MKTSPRVHIEKLGAEYPTAVESCLSNVGFFDTVPTGSRVFLKPNLTFPEYRPGVMTSYACTAAVTECLVERGYRVVIGEADSGGYNRFAMEHVFQRVGLTELAERFGATLVNLTLTEPEFMPVTVGRKQLSVPVPRLLLREIDAFITLPVPKIHMNTLVSMSIKNQWGCIQEPSERLKLHPYFAQVMFELNRQLPRAYSLIDGRYGLTRSGPMQGDVVELDWLLASDDIVAADRICCRLMQVDENKVGYLRHFRKSGWWTDASAIRVNADLTPFLREKFYLERAWTDYPGLFCFRSSFLAWLGYHSPLADLLHRALYLFRKPFFDHELERKKAENRSQSFEPLEEQAVNRSQSFEPLEEQAMGLGTLDPSRPAPP